MMEKYFIHVLGDIPDRPICVRFDNSLNRFLIGGNENDRQTIERIMRVWFHIDLLYKSREFKETKPRRGAIRFVVKMERSKFIAGLDLVCAEKGIQIIETKSFGRLMR